MIPLYVADNLTAARNLSTYNGLSLNNPSDPANDIFELNVVKSSTQLDSVSDANQTRDGLEAYDVRKVAKLIRIDGVVRAPTLAKLYDKIELLAKTFDPAKVPHENPSTQGFLAWDFNVPTLDTGNYPGGLIASRYYLRPHEMPEPMDSEFTGTAAFFTLQMVARDPRRYLQATSQITATGTLSNPKADYRSWPTLTLNMSGAGSATCSITNTTSLGAQTLTLNLSTTVNTDVVVVDFERRTIKKNGVDAPQLYASGDFFEVEPGSQTISNANFTNVSSWTLVWRPAFCL